VFDEGHHVFDAADSMFAAALTGHETIELRRWIVGPEGTSAGGGAGLRRGWPMSRAMTRQGGEAIEDAVEAAQALASRRLAATARGGRPFGPIERCSPRSAAFATYARAESRATPATASRPNCRIAPSWSRLPEWLRSARRARPAAAQAGRAARGGAGGRARLAGRPGRARGSRARATIGWRADRRWRPGCRCSRASVARPIPISSTGWRSSGDAREYRHGLHRHWLDPTRPFAEVVLEARARRLLTSATLTGGERRLAGAIARSGAPHLASRRHRGSRRTARSTMPPAPRC
jgi:ATP-dependent DNA helicase DinG